MVQNFQPQVPLPPDATYSAEVQGLKSTFDCDIVKIDNATMRSVGLPWYSVLAPFWVADIKIGNCSISKAIVAEGADHNYHHDPYATQNFQGRITNITCSDGVDNSLHITMRPDHSSYPDQRILMTVADLRWVIPADLVGAPIQTQDAIWWVEEVTAVLCRPSYSLDTYQVEYPATSNISQGPVNAVLTANETGTLPGLSVAQLSYAILTLVNRMYIGSGGPDYVLANNVQNFFQLLAAVNNGSRQEAFMDPQVLLDIGSSVWKGISSQLVNENLTIPNDETIQGSVKHSEERLQVKLLSAVLMAVTLGLLCGIVIVVMMTRPWDLVPCDPSSMLAKAAIIAASPSTIKAITGLGPASTSEIEKSLGDYSFWTKLTHIAGGTFNIEATHETQLEEPSSVSTELEENNKVSWWKPMATRIWFSCTAAIMPASIIAILEVLQHISDRNQGLVAVASSGTVNSRVLASYLPASIMLIVATLFISIQDTAAILAPYSRLKSGNAPISSMTDSLVGKMTLHALLLSTKSLSIGHIISLLAMFVSTFLTIVVSGLYTVTPVSAGSNATLTQVDRFDFTQNNLSISDNDAAAITNLIEWSNLSFPDWTFGGLVFNKVVAQGSLPSTGLAMVDVPAYRARLDCDVPIDGQHLCCITLRNPKWIWDDHSIHRYDRHRC